jgi:hypothetical protein
MEECQLSLKECQLEIEEHELKIECKRLELQKLKQEFNANNIRSFFWSFRNQILKKMVVVDFVMS